MAGIPESIQTQGAKARHFYASTSRAPKLRPIAALGTEVGGAGGDGQIYLPNRPANGVHAQYAQTPILKLYDQKLGSQWKINLSPPSPSRPRPAGGASLMADAERQQRQAIEFGNDLTLKQPRQQPATGCVHAVKRAYYREVHDVWTVGFTPDVRPVCG